mgnify:FL=1
MNDEQLLQLHAMMTEIFGENMANPDHEPIRFEFQIRFAMFKLGWRIEKHVHKPQP